MPDAAGNFKGMAVNAEAWERIFGVSELERQKQAYLDALRVAFELAKGKS